MSSVIGTKSNWQKSAALGGVLFIWFVVAVWGSLQGVFDSGHKPPIALGVAVASPVILFLLLRREWRAFSEFVSSANMRVLIFCETWRVMGVVFLILYWKGLLPGGALPAGLGDMAVGISAPFVAMTIGRRNGPAWPFIAWSLFGMADLIVAVSMGVLSSPSAAGILAGPITSRLMGQFPLSLIPTFFVPLFFILHLISWRAIKGASAATAEAA